MHPQKRQMEEGRWGRGRSNMKNAEKSEDSKKEKMSLEPRPYVEVEPKEEGGA